VPREHILGAPRGVGREIAFRFACTVYDALYVAAAVEGDCPVVTVDRRFYDVMVQSPLEGHVLRIEDA